MALFDNHDTIKQYFYLVKEVKLLIPDEDTMTIPNERVSFFSIEKDFEGMYFPLFKISISMAATTFYKILEHKNECKLYIRIQKFYLINENTEKSLVQDVINDTFIIVYDNGTDDMLRREKELRNVDNYETIIENDETKLEKIENKISFYLFKEMIDSTKGNINKIFSNVNVTDVLLYLCLITNNKNVIISPPDNTKIYSEFCIPLLSYISAFQYIDTYYGIYEKGSMIFFDFFYTYILPYEGRCTVYPIREKQNLNIVIPRALTTRHKEKLGVLIKKRGDANDDYVIGDYNTISIVNQSISNNYIHSNNIELVDSYSGKDEKTESNAINRTGENYFKAIEDKTENPYLGSMYTAQTNAMSTVIEVRMLNTDITLFSPFKKYNVICEDSNYTEKYNGEYIIAGIRHDFISEGINFTDNAIIILRKTK